jgi:acyl-CoA thioesterase-1
MTTDAELREDEDAPHNVVVDNPALPRVLLLGDSISLGYTVGVRQLLSGRANVHRPPCNCQHTAFGLAHLREWLGAGPWHVVHFNWGIWDTHLLHDGHPEFHMCIVPTAQEDLPGAYVRHERPVYQEHLRQIIEILRETGARLIWASSTPVRCRKGARQQVLPDYNDAAAEVMAEAGIAINDLHAFALPEIDAWQSDDLVHFAPLGNDRLAERVAHVVAAAL